jgi:hypothetical protein
MEKLMIRTLVAVLALAALSAAHSPSWAAGAGETRNLSSASIASCEHGKLKEHYFEYGNIHGVSENIEIACLVSENHAEWLLVAGRQCWGNKVCGRVKPQKPPFAFPPEHLAANSSDSPKLMTYGLRQYAIGHDCDLGSYKMESEDKNYYWSCKEYKTFSSETPTIVKTIGDTSQAQDDFTNPPKLPIETTLPAESYTVNEAMEVIDAP